MKCISAELLTTRHHVYFECTGHPGGSQLHFSHSHCGEAVLPPSLDHSCTAAGAMRLHWSLPLFETSECFLPQHYTRQARMASKEACKGMQAREAEGWSKKAKRGGAEGRGAKA